MFTPTERRRQSTVLTNATARAVGVSRKPALGAAAFRLLGRNSVRSNVRRIIGTSDGAILIHVERRNTTHRNLLSLMNSAAYAFDVVLTTKGCWKSIISTQTRNLGLRIECIRRRYASSYGGKKWGTFNFSAPIVIASKPGNRVGADIACRRIQDAVDRPDLFIGQRAPEPVQQPLFGGEEAA